MSLNSMLALLLALVSSCAPAGLLAQDLKLVEAANNQPYVNAPVLLIFCMHPSRVKMNFPQHIIKKFSVQDATLAAAYAQLAARNVGAPRRGFLGGRRRGFFGTLPFRLRISQTVERCGSSQRG